MQQTFKTPNCKIRVLLLLSTGVVKKLLHSEVSCGVIIKCSEKLSCRKEQDLLYSIGTD